MRIQRVGADVLGELSGPAVFWVVDAPPAVARRVLADQHPRVVTPRAGDPARRRGPSIAVVVDDRRLADEYVTRLLPATIVPVLVTGAYRRDEPIGVRFAPPVVGTDPRRTLDHVHAAVDRLRAEEHGDWWSSLGAQVAPATVPAAPPGGWRQFWDRSRPRLGGDAGIWP